MLGDDRRDLGPVFLEPTKLQTFKTIIPAVQNLGRRHRGYGVTAKHYEAVGAALLWTLEQGLGSAFTPQVKDAWMTTYTAVADVMRGASKEPKYGELSPTSGGPEAARSMSTRSA